jgi:glycosyltransferase involved in cell wall biosynthesis
MKIVCVTSWFSENMGYNENLFPKALAKLGHEVHVISSNAQVYFNSPDYKKVYEPFIGPNIVECGTKTIDGFVLHRLPYYVTKGRIRGKFTIIGLGIKNLYEKLSEIKPDIIQVYSVAETASLVCAQYSKKNNVKFFTESHMHASVFRKNDNRNIKERLYSFLNLINPEIRFVNRQTQICYPIAPDVADIVETFYRVPKNKIKIQSLGIDTDLFIPITSDEQIKERNRIRNSFGIKETDIVCIYTGRFTKSKNPVCLAQAINLINEKRSDIKAIFLGSGTDEDNNFIKSQKGCYVHPFVKLDKLPSYYWAADIGVWPREESTSQLDAAACGLPLILSNRIKVLERVDGNGLLYEEGNYKDLAEKILELSDPSLRKHMSFIGVSNVTKKFSWDAISRERVQDYEIAMNLK